jgi:AcrR family transcriptional regulator
MGESDAAVDTSAPRRDRRKARTRQALIDAARRIMAERGVAEVSIQQITDAADVGFGSFYNYFPDKAQLFETALEQVFDEYGALIESVTEHMDDPAEVVAAGIKMTGRLTSVQPEMARIFVRMGISSISRPSGMAARALRDIERGIATGRFTVDNPYAALAMVSGGLFGLLHMRAVLDNSALGEDICSSLAEQVLRGLGVPAADAGRIAHLPVPEPGENLGL